jgi:hypothetical protein
MRSLLRAVLWLVVMSPVAALADDASDNAYVVRLMEMNRAVAAGDAWSEGVPKIIKVLGQPAAATPKQITWAWVQGPYCTTVVAKLNPDGFIDSLLPVPYGKAAPPKDFAACKKLATKRAKVGKLAPPRKVNVDPAMNTVLAQWRDGKLKEIHDAAHPDLQKVAPLSTYEQLAKVFASNAGKLVKIGKPVYSYGNFGWVATVPLTYEKHAAEAVLVFRLVDGKPRLYGFNQGLTDDVDKEGLLVDAPKAARKLLDLILANKLAQVEPMMYWDLANTFRANKAFAPKLKELVAKYGKLTEIFNSGTEARGGTFKIAFTLTGTNGKGEAHIELTRVVGQWMMSDFVITPPAK